MFDQERSFERGEGREFVIPLMAFFLHTCYRHIHHILTLHMSGDTWPAAFYLIIEKGRHINIDREFRFCPICVLTDILSLKMDIIFSLNVRPMKK